jgi:methionyl-tRNA synthetase
MALRKFLDLYQNVELRDAYKEIVNMAVVGNVYLERTAPWTLIKNGDMKNAQKVLYLCLNLCKALAILASPIIPSKMEEVWTEQLNFAGKPDEDNKAEDASKINIEKGHKVLAPKPLFRRIDDDYLKELIAHFSIPYEIKPNK